MSKLMNKNKFSKIGQLTTSQLTQSKPTSCLALNTT